MKKFLIILSAGAFLFLTSCGTKKEDAKKEEGGMSEATKKNIEANNAIMKMFETGDYSKIGDYLAPGVVDHAGPKGDIVGIDSMKAYFAQMGEMMSNMKNDIVKTLADDEYVMCWVKGSATAKVDIPDFGMKAGDSHTGESVEVSKFKDGKCTDHWTFMSAADIGKMMSAMQPPAGAKTDAPVKDPTSK
ncbi:MAG TPA: nuclear transport factor 2 family protein [Chitinophagaceae bacterium]|jgi:predicted SnoaL-like aldol condensation-catalyzing enzyme|nr:nuclear transport factor 2 family protein [Chitinophagaceae bacterium]